MGLFGNKTRFDFDPAMQQAVNEYAAMPAQEKPKRWVDGGKFTGKDALGILFSSLGDSFAPGRESMTDNAFARHASARESLAKQQQEMQQRQAVLKAMAAKGIDPQVAGIFAGDPVAARQVLLPQQQQPQQPPAFVRNLEAWNQMTPEQQAQVARMQSVLNPQFTTGMDGQSYQRPPASTGNYDSDEWEDIPEEEARRLGGAGGNASGGFPRYR